MICPCILNKILEALIQDISILCIVTKKEKCNTILHACNIFSLKIYPCTQKLKQCCKRKKIKMYKEWHFFYEWLCSRFNKVCPLNYRFTQKAIWWNSCKNQQQPCRRYNPADTFGLSEDTQWDPQIQVSP